MRILPPRLVRGIELNVIRMETPTDGDISKGRGKTQPSTIIFYLWLSQRPIGPTPRARQVRAYLICKRILTADRNTAQSVAACDT